VYSSRSWAWAKIPLDPHLLLYGDTLGTLGPHLLLLEDTFGSSYPIIWRYPWVLISYYMEVPSGFQVLLYKGTHRSAEDVTMLILPIPIPNAIGSIGIGSLQREYESWKFRKTNDSFGFLDSTRLWSNLIKKPCFQKKLFLTKKWST